MHCDWMSSRHINWHRQHSTSSREHQSNPLDFPIQYLNLQSLHPTYYTTQILKLPNPKVVGRGGKGKRAGHRRRRDFSLLYLQSLSCPNLTFPSRVGFILHQSYLLSYFSYGSRRWLVSIGCSMHNCKLMNDLTLSPIPGSTSELLSTLMVPWSRSLYRGIPSGLLLLFYLVPTANLVSDPLIYVRIVELRYNIKRVIYTSLPDSWIIGTYSIDLRKEASRHVSTTTIHAHS